MIGRYTFSVKKGYITTFRHTILRLCGKVRGLNTVQYSPDRDETKSTGSRLRSQLFRRWLLSDA